MRKSVKFEFRVGQCPLVNIVVAYLVRVEAIDDWTSFITLERATVSPLQNDTVITRDDDPESASVYVKINNSSRTKDKPCDDFQKERWRIPSAINRQRFNKSSLPRNSVRTKVFDNGKLQ